MIHQTVQIRIFTGHIKMRPVKILFAQFDESLLYGPSEDSDFHSLTNHP